MYGKTGKEISRKGNSESDTANKSRRLESKEKEMNFREFSGDMSCTEFGALRRVTGENFMRTRKRVEMISRVGGRGSVSQVQNQSLVVTALAGARAAPQL